MPLVDDVLSGSRRALARAITAVENNYTGADEVLSGLYPHTGRAHLIGVTGAPGTGKSSLVNQLALEYRRQQKTVAIIAVDPTSPFSGGAILGDRIRMRDLSGDSGVFIRSMATRGSLGGLARATADVVKVLDAGGFDIILIETVGAGQSEVDIARHAHTVLVVEAPGLGDDVQAIKAGILEIADILVVNKADDPRTDKTVRALRAMLDLAHPGDYHAEIHHGKLMQAALGTTEASHTTSTSDAWEVPVITTNALAGENVPALLEAIQHHRDYLHTSGEINRRDRARIAAELDSTLRETLITRLLASVPTAELASLIDQIARRETTPQKAAALLTTGSSTPRRSQTVAAHSEEKSSS
jgi:LAO/AO transport system kinase